LATIKDEWRDPINSALADGAACLVGTVSEDGQPQISPKGSVLVHDASTLAYWERSFRTASANIKSNAKIVIYFRNPGKAEVLPQGATLRFYGTARVVESGPVREAVMSKVVKRELDADPGRKGVAVLVDIKRITDLRGNDVS
jgi:predicted pyridoxine 5'-phosphate oxidase superfamily flavin-nucleotide-binding protein